MTAPEVCQILDGYRQRRQPITFDLEGGVGNVTCYSIADSPHEAVVVPFVHADGSSVWDEDDEIAIWEATRALMEDVDVPKVLQNFLYDGFVLAFSYGIVIRGLYVDTMVMHFEAFPEFEKSLGFQASIYTNEPYYKAERRSTDERIQLIYCGKDACVTYECWKAAEKLLMPRQLEHFKFNMSLLHPLLWMMLRGIRYDYENAKTHRQAVQKRIYALQDRINREAATHPSRIQLRNFYEAAGQLQTSGAEDALARGARAGNPSKELLEMLAEAFCVARRVEKKEVEETSWQPMRRNAQGKWVKDGKRLKGITATHDWHTGQEPPFKDFIKWARPVTKTVTKNLPVEITSLKDVRRFVRGAVKGQCRRACAILTLSHRRGFLLPAQRGELATLLGLSVKIRASGRDRDEEDVETGDIVRGDERDANWFLYEHCALPKQYVKEGNRLTDRLASDAEAVIKAWLASSKTEKGRDRRALWFAALKSLLTEARNLTAMPDDDGRIRSSYNLVGSKTHRLSNSGSPTRTSRLNLQTITKSHRRFYLADPGHEMCQRDLSGADGWTVAAYCAMLGDPNMLEDYRASLKPAQIITLMLKDGSAVNRLSRDDLKPLCKPITEETHWQYFAMKRGQHGWSYRMGDKTTSDQILTDSIKKSGRPIYVAPKECARLRDTCFFVRYPGIPKMHDYFRRQLIEIGSITASNGFTRRFYGRKDEDDTLREAIAHLPQVYTTYATCLALHRLWTDPTNRRPNGSLIIEPLHTVHDSLVTQWLKEVTEWARERMKVWFDNPIDIARTRLVIPASGTFGPSWGEQESKL